MANNEGEQVASNDYKMKQGDNFRIPNSNSRIVYDPQWRRSKPFLAFRNGSAVNSFYTLSAALRYFGFVPQNSVSDYITKG